MSANNNRKDVNDWTTMLTTCRPSGRASVSTAKEPASLESSVTPKCRHLNPLLPANPQTANSADDSEDDNLGSRDNNIEVEKPSLKRSSPENDSRPVAYVIPAFETFYTQFLFPANKTELLNQIDTGVVKPFRIDLWPAGHQATNYTHWYKSSIPYEVKWEADFEPYVVVKKSAAKFDTRFLGFGWNKVAYTMLLDALGYRFVVLPEVFVIHLPHSPSMDVYRFRNSPLFRRCLERFKVEFIKELAHNYGVRSLKYLQFRQRPNGI